ncbi:MAG TPA: hypothetical protein VK252_03465 [Solirubrobacteraceae bacterium]|nr:hypothetical protein [Solirubrobacteraceae bacterium]
MSVTTTSGLKRTHAPASVAATLASAAPLVLAVAALVLAASLAAPAPAGAAELAWRLEQPAPPGQAGEQVANPLPVGLGKIGDIEFWAPNRGLLITAGNPPTVPAGVWTYNGQGWHELANVCGASDGRIAWAGPDEFWTISNGIPGQAGSEDHGLPPIEDDTLCRFASGEVAASYATPAFQASSYQVIHGAACFESDDCWFAGAAVPAPGTGAFQLHWNGSSLSAEANPDLPAVADMRRSGQSVFESAQVQPLAFEPFALGLINPNEVSPAFETVSDVPLYAGEEPPSEQQPLLLSTDLQGGEQGELWAASDPVTPRSQAHPGQVAIVRRAEGGWEQVVGPKRDPDANPFTKYSPQEDHESENELIDGIATEPAGDGAWVTVSSPANNAKGLAAGAIVRHLSRDGTVTEAQTLTSPIEAQGAAERIVCPAVDDCWMATAAGWLYHYSDGEQLELNNDSAFAHLITFRPHSQGIPEAQPDTLPEDDSGLLGEPPHIHVPLPESSSPLIETKITKPLLSDLHARLIPHDTLELRFHVAVQARLRLLARRHRTLVAKTPERTFAPGARKLLLRLDPRRWPTKLELQSKPLASLPTVTVRGASVDTISTGLVVLPHTPSFTSTLP